LKDRKVKAKILAVVTKFGKFMERKMASLKNMGLNNIFGISVQIAPLKMTKGNTAPRF
jgi:hypothetical protein